jgi:hypothetical protein
MLCVSACVCARATLAHLTSEKVYSRKIKFKVIEQDGKWCFCVLLEHARVGHLTCVRAGDDLENRIVCLSHFAIFQSFFFITDSARQTNKTQKKRQLVEVEKKICFFTSILILRTLAVAPTRDTLSTPLATHCDRRVG